MLRMTVGAKKAAFSRFAEDQFPLKIGERPHVELDMIRVSAFPLAGDVVDSNRATCRQILMPSWSSLLTPRASGNWWARWDSNPEPRDSLYLDVSTGSGLSLHPRPQAVGRVRGALACDQELSDRSIQLPGSLCTFRRCIAGLAQDRHGPVAEAFPEFTPFTSRLSLRRHHFLMSPLH